jgi:hypothetical protein
MAYGVLIESMIQAKNIDALNRSVKAEVDVAGGGLLALSAPTTQGDDVWTAEEPDSELGGLWIAYNPEVKYIEVNGKKYAGLSADARDYTNLAGEVFDAFKPKVGDEIVITVDAVDNTSASAVAGDILESKAGQTLFTRVAAATGATAGSTAFEIEWVGTIDFPKANIGIDKVKAFKAVCVQE